jgi:hypothetical protein
MLDRVDEHFAMQLGQVIGSIARRVLVSRPTHQTGLAVREKQFS